MLKIFVTGDNHIGKRYDRYPDVKDILIESRFKCIEDMVSYADSEQCNLFVVTGDLFDNISTIKVSDVNRVVNILGEFGGNVLILPGNHDYYTGDEKVWKDFEKALEKTNHNITVLKEMRTYSYEIGDEKIAIYPAFCEAKHSDENNLSWIREADIETKGFYNIGIAHGALKGITPDIEGRYYLMSEAELMEIPMDAWLVGHTHIPYPDIKDTAVSGYRVFNPGTHEQTDYHNNTVGECFVIEINKSDNETDITAKRYISGQIRYYDLQLDISGSEDRIFENELENLVSELDSHSIVRARLKGSVSEQDYENRKIIYQKVLERFLSYECADEELSEKITIEKIRSEYSELSFVSKLMEKLIDEPVELQMAYELINQCKE